MVKRVKEKQIVPSLLKQQINKDEVGFPNINVQLSNFLDQKDILAIYEK